MLLAAAMLWAGCSDADKNADKLPEQEKVNTEQSLSVKKENDEKARRDSVFKASIDSVLKSVGNLSTHGTTTLYGCRPENGCSVKIDENGIPVIDEKYLQGRARGVAKTPTFEELEARLRGRHTETEEAIQKRLASIKLEIENSIHITY